MSSYTAITRSNRIDRQTGRRWGITWKAWVCLKRNPSFVHRWNTHRQTDTHRHRSVFNQPHTTQTQPETFRSQCCLSFAWQFVDVCTTKLLSIWRKKYCISSSDTDSRQRLRSASRHLLSVPRHRRTLGRRAFAVSGPTACNSLPHDLPNPSCYDSYFGRFLKSILFSY